MATPTTYDLSYDEPCSVEGGCGEDECGGATRYVARPEVFCKDVEIIPASITIGGITFTPQIHEGVLLLAA